MRGRFLRGKNGKYGVVCQKMCAGRACVLRCRTGTADAEHCVDAVRRDQRRNAEQTGTDFCSDRGVFGLRGRGGADEQTRAADSVLRGGFLACNAGDRYSCIRRTAAGTVAANGGCDGGGSGSVTFDEKRKEKGERKQGACTARTQVNIKGTCILKRCFC